MLNTESDALVYSGQVWSMRLLVGRDKEVCDIMDYIKTRSLTPRVCREVETFELCRYVSLTLSSALTNFSVSLFSYRV